MSPGKHSDALVSKAGQPVPPTKHCAIMSALNLTQLFEQVPSDSEPSSLFPIHAPFCRVCTCSPPGTPKDAADYLGNAGVSIRGSTTRKQYTKKSYSIELRQVLFCSQQVLLAPVRHCPLVLGASVAKPAGSALLQL